ncbi:alpha/beta-hydrolase [Aspergillus ellipticus CBS 707.79]|uniref:Alpha/beta-hydrolase n=1 Tax=Aspergillus ellipticus CBS 707.79 TaxID=1448320 RepID=A0A319D3S7_9EURO|nr:alpha/beta-hydrolase [Aspergillus ellipticus CBS 707.79]
MNLQLAAGFGWVLAKAGAVGIWSALTAPFQGPHGGATIVRHAAMAVSRFMIETFTLDQILYAVPPDSPRKNFEAYSKSKGIALNTVELPDGTTAFWMGNPDAERTIICYPGGAYCIPALTCHIKYVDAIMTNLQEAGIDAGVLFLKYDLATQAPYPRQLAQAVAILRYAVETLGKQPSKIGILGDSAGAHLILSVLSHLSHPHPDIPAMSLDESLAGALLLSPWMIDSRTDYESYRQNKKLDIIGLKPLLFWAGLFFGDAAPDSYNQPAVAPEGWWWDLPVKRIFVGVGGDEILLDSTLAVVRKIEVRIALALEWSSDSG